MTKSEKEVAEHQLHKNIQYLLAVIGLNAKKSHNYS